MVSIGQQSRMTTFVRQSDALEHTETIARDVSAVLRPGDTVRLVGDLGAGKTTFVRALCAAMGVDPSEISSPTFVLMHVHERKNQPPIAHLDCYRLSDDDELGALGYDELIERGVITLIEWPERAPDLADPATSCTITIEHTGETSRRFTIDPPQSWRDRTAFGALTSRGPAKCPATGAPVHPESPSWPFASEQARMSDLHGWMSERYTISRPIEQADLEQGE